MNKIKEIYYNKYETIDDYDSEIFNKTYNNIKKRYNKRKKIIYSTCSLFIVLISSFGICYAKEIKEVFNNLSIRKHEVNNIEITDIYNEKKDIIEIDKNIDIKKNDCEKKFGYEGPDEADSCYKYYLKEDIEKLFNIKLINNSMEKSIRYYPTVVHKDADDNYKSISFKVYNLLLSNDYNIPRVSKTINLRTKYADENNIVQSLHHNENVEILYVDKLSTNAYFYNTTERVINMYITYDKILYYYSFTFNSNYTKEQQNDFIKEFINSFNI